MQKQIVSFSRTLTYLALVALLTFAFSANSAVGQYYGIYVDLFRQQNGNMPLSSYSTNRNHDFTWVYSGGGSYRLRTSGTIGIFALVEGHGAVHINDGGRIELVDVLTGGTLYNDDWYAGSITTVNVRGGTLNNNDSRITELNVYDGSVVSSGNRGTITTANVHGGTVNNDANSTITTVNVHGGTVNNNGSSSTITTVNVLGGAVNNRGNNAIISEANVHGGTLTNDSNRTITNATINAGGSLVNAGTVTNLTYNGGTYTLTGTTNRSTAIGTLTVTANSGTTDWGNVTTAHVNSGGTLTNNSSRTITNATINTGGSLTNAGTITNLTYRGGNYTLSGTTTRATAIGTLTVAANSGTTDWGNVTRANVNSGGTLQNGSNRTITNATMSGGTLNNAGSVTNLTYNSGNYTGTGTIGTLTVAGNAGNIDWGTVDTVNVNNGGTLQNRNASSIVRATVNDGAELNNYAIIGSAIVAGEGYLNNFGNASIESAIVRRSVSGDGGSLYNFDYTTIGSLDVSGDRSFVRNDHHTSIGTLNVGNDGIVENHGNTAIGSATVTGSGAMLNNFGNTSIESAVVSRGILSNSHRAIIESAVVDDRGILSNVRDATIKSLVVNNGGNASNSQWATVESLVVNDGGRVNNSSTIGSATVSGGRLENREGIGGTTIGTITIENNGFLVNNRNVIVGSLFLDSGMVNNTGRIDNMTYTAGDYTRTGTGSIGNLTIAGELTAGNWGQVDNLAFARDGRGFVSISDFAGGMPSLGMQAGSVNLDFGRVSFDMTGLGTYADTWQSSFEDMFADDNGFSLASVFGTTNPLDGNLTSFDITWDNYLFSMIEDGVFATGWGLNGGQITWNNAFAVAWVNTFDTDPLPIIPEPATLAILGLGLAGLGLARRRKRQ